MRMRIVTFLTGLFMVGVFVMASSAKVTCATPGHCSFYISGSGFGYPQEGDDTTWNGTGPTPYNRGRDKAFKDASDKCTNETCAANCGGASSDYDVSRTIDVGGGPGGMIFQTFYNSSGVMTTQVFATGGCTCATNWGDSGIPYSTRNGEPVALTFGQKVMRFFGLVPKPSSNPKKVGG